MCFQEFFQLSGGDGNERCELQQSLRAGLLSEQLSAALGGHARGLNARCFAQRKQFHVCLEKSKSNS